MTFKDVRLEVALLFGAVRTARALELWLHATLEAKMLVHAELPSVRLPAPWAGKVPRHSATRAGPWNEVPGYHVQRSKRVQGTRVPGACGHGTGQYLFQQLRLAG